MYVQNDVTRDSRVLREATSLAAAGHRVTIVATDLAAVDGRTAAQEVPPGVAIVRVPRPTGRPWWVTAIRAPWQLRHPAAILLIPWLVVRAGWVLIVNRMLGRPISMAWVEYVRRWRVDVLGWCSAAVVAAPVADVHHAHDMDALPAAAAGARRDGSAYIYDSHEIFTGWGRILGQPAWLRSLMAGRERRLARGAFAVVTVNDAVASVLIRRLNVRRIRVVHNCPVRWVPPVVPGDRIRRAAGIPPEVPIVLCHGALMAGRGLHETAAALRAPALADAHLVLLGYGAPYIVDILADPALLGRVHHLPAVAPGDVLSWISGASVDVMAIGPGSENGRLSTPNKLFESLMAGVPVVVSDFPPMRDIVLDPVRGPLGAVCDPSDPASIAAAIRSILDLDPAARAALRTRVLEAAHRRWNWETEAAVLVALYAELAASAEMR